MSYTVKELIEELKSYEQDKEVLVVDLDGNNIPIESTGFFQPSKSIVIYLEDEGAEDEEPEDDEPK